MSNAVSHAAIGPMISNIKKQFCLFFVLLSLLLQPILSQAQVNPEIEWKTWSLPGFELIYDAKHQEVADLYASRLLKTPTLLKTYFPELPEKTVFVINDRTDMTNGYATPLPYPTIVVFPVLPGPHETISDTGDWAQEISLHEYTHIASFEHRRGAAKALYYVFGNIITPNLLLPRWWLEGIAVDMETRTGQFGRLRSPMQDAAIRTLSMEENWLDRDLSEINETSIHTWPQGARPYLYGSLMWNEMIRRYGNQVIFELHHRYGGRFPFFIEGPLQEKGQGSYSAHFDDVKLRFQKKVEAQKKILNQVKISSGSPFTIKGATESFHPEISPDGLKLLSLVKDDANKRAVKILVRKNTKEEFSGLQNLGEIESDLNESLKEFNPDPRSDAPPGGTIQRLSWFPDSRKFVYDKVDTVDRFRDTSELYIYDLKTRKSEPLTKGQRAREAAVSPSGKKLAFVQLGPAVTRLAILTLENKSQQTIYKSPLQGRISHPSFVDEQNVVFSERVEGREILKLINLGNLKTEILLSTYPEARFPKVIRTSEGPGILFSSTLNGVPNAYLLNLRTRTTKPLTHTHTAITSSALDTYQNQLLATELTPQGFELKKFALPSNLPNSLPKVSPLLLEDYPLASTKPRTPQATTAELNSLRGNIKDYEAGGYLWPRYWLPNLGIYNNGAYLGGSIAGSDPLAKHQYSLSFLYDTQPQTLSNQFTYTNNQTPAMISLLGMDLKNSVPFTNINFRQQKYTLQSVWDIPQLSTDLYAGFGYLWMGRDYDAPYLAGDTESHGPTLLALYSDISQSGAQISPEGGQQVRTQVTHLAGNSSSLNESYNLFELSAQKFWNRWLPAHHAVLTRFSGQYIDRDIGEIRSANYAFTLNSSPFASQLPSIYVVRGYAPAQFLAKNLATYTLEYRLPLAYTYRGSGTTPLFIKKFHAALISDLTTLEGFSYNRDLKVYQRVGTWEPFTAVGLELKSDITLGFHFPVTAMVGTYYAFNATPKGESSFVFNLQF